ERARQMDSWAAGNAEPGVVATAFGKSGAERVNEALKGTSDELRGMKPGEREYLLASSLRVWEGAQDARSVESLGGMVKQEGARRAVLDAYPERAVEFMRGCTAGGKTDLNKRLMAEAYAGGAANAAPDALSLRKSIEALGPDGAGFFADAQTGGAMPDGNGKSDKAALSRTLAALNEGPESAQARTFTMHVLASGLDWTYRQEDVTESGYIIDNGPSAMTGPMATQLARLLHPGDAAGQGAVQGRLAGILQSKAATQVFAPAFGSSLFGQSDAAKQASIAVRFQVLAAIDRNPAITAESLGSTPWTNAALVQTLAEPQAQVALQAHGDQAFPLAGTDLDNFVGTAMNLPPKIPKDEMPEQAAAREAATADHRYSYYDDGHNEEPVRLIRKAIQEAAAAVGGDPNQPAVSHLPVTVSNAETGPVQIPLFRIDGPKGSQFVDNQGHRFTSFEDWQKRNTLPDGVMSYPKGGHMQADAHGKAILESGDTPETHDTLHHVEHALDKAALVGGLVAGGAMVIGSGGTLAPVVLAVAGGYTAARGAQNLGETYSRGGTINPLESSQARADWINVAAGALTGAGAMSGRIAQLAGGTNVLSRGMATATVATRYAAVGADATATANQGYELYENWDRMSPQDKIVTGLNLAFWGLGARAQMREPKFFSFSAQREALLNNSRPSVVRDPAMQADAVAIRRQGGKTGDLGEIEIVAGKDASPADIDRHVEIARAEASYSGVEGRLRRLFTRDKAARTPGTRAFTVDQEVKKIGGYLEEAEARQKKGGLSAEEAADLDIDIALYREDLAAFNEEMTALEANPQAAGARDASDIAKPSLAARRQARKLGYPNEPKPGFQWEIIDGKLRARSKPVKGQDAAFRAVYEWDAAAGSLKRAPDDPLRPVAKGAGQSVTLDIKDPALLNLLKKRAALQKKQTKPADPAVSQQLKDYSRDVGAKLAENWVRDFVKKIPGAKKLKRQYGGPEAPSVSGDFDDVWSYEDASGVQKFIVIESKGGASTLGTRKVAGGRTAYQGTREYFAKILEVMENRGGAAEQTAMELRKASKENVSYVAVKEGDSAAGDTVDVQEFDITRPGR
ncbi:MAG TPA: DUF4781 domain-containing protein, partial [Stellaceae bacterium]|nr:DUF4781 domain-containing protein [Stellaceae bacterium]